LRESVGLCDSVALTDIAEKVRELGVGRIVSTAETEWDDVIQALALRVRPSDRHIDRLGAESAAVGISLGYLGEDDWGARRGLGLECAASVVAISPLVRPCSIRRYSTGRAKGPPVVHIADTLSPDWTIAIHLSADTACGIAAG